MIRLPAEPNIQIAPPVKKPNSYGTERLAMSLDAAAIAKFKVAELKAELVARGLDNKGKKRPSNV